MFHFLLFFFLDGWSSSSCLTVISVLDSGVSSSCLVSDTAGECEAAMIAAAFLLDIIPFTSRSVGNGHMLNSAMCFIVDVLILDNTSKTADSPSDGLKTDAFANIRKRSLAKVEHASRTVLQ